MLPILQKQKSYRFQGESFIPFACMFNPQTVITKNGELLQVIKLDGFDFNPSSDKPFIDTRESIRLAMARYLPDDTYAIYFTTVRRKRAYNLDTQIEMEFPQIVDRHWQNLNKFGNLFSNEVYISIIKEGQSTKIGGIIGFIRGLFAGAERKFRNNYLDECAAELTSITSAFMDDLKEYSPSILGIKKEGESYYFEHMEFFSRILGHGPQKYEVNEVDLSTQLGDGITNLNFHSLEMLKGNEARFASILSVKNHMEAMPVPLDYFLQLPFEMVITQTMDIIPGSVAQAYYKPIANSYRISGDSDLAEKSGITAITEPDPDASLAYCQQQVTVMILEETAEKLEESTNKAFRGLNEMGYISFREDIGLEMAYYSQLPGNFEFLKRIKPLSTILTGAFANVQSFPSGHHKNATSMLMNNFGAPFFFGLNNAQSGHTLLLTSDLYEKKSVAGFLLCQAARHKPQIIIIDRSDSFKTLSLLLESKQIDIKLAKGGNPINLLSFPNNPANRNFITYLIASIISLGGGQITPEIQNKIKECTASVMANSEDAKNIPTMIEAMHQAGLTSESALLKKWWESAPEVFGEIDFSNPLVSINIAHLRSKKQYAIPVLLYLLHLINSRIQGHNTIVVLDEALDAMLSNSVQAVIGPWLDSLKTKNALALLCSSTPANLSQIQLITPLLNRIPTKILGQLTAIDDKSLETLELGETGVSICHHLNPMDNELYFKHGNATVVLSLKLRNMKEISSVLEAPDSIAEQIAEAYENKNSKSGWLKEVLRKISAAHEINL